ncbi:hypothetical protein [Campylobacter sp. 19-13652]|uniref:hypothetical protein n=1 Tax=Campylobacter sp. 19-13652 TaxID=2840180 RepID=UPI001C758107|nr:hypothetical protein [Campylobacter sp. 19-13652]BCX79264.1 hypothetical protein LBC_07260 [Campylobacter sp. 19-13652]
MKMRKLSAQKCEAVMIFKHAMSGRLNLKAGAMLEQRLKALDEIDAALKRSQLEKIEQDRVIQWARSVGLVCFRISNGDGKKSAVAGRQAKLNGVLAGVSDLQCIHLGRKNLFIEMKRRGGKPSDLSEAQRAFGEFVNASENNAFVVGYGAVDAIGKIKGWLDA